MAFPDFIIFCESRVYVASRQSVFLALSASYVSQVTNENGTFGMLIEYKHITH